MLADQNTLVFEHVKVHMLTGLGSWSAAILHQALEGIIVILVGKITDCLVGPLVCMPYDHIPAPQLPLECFFIVILSNASVFMII